MGMSGFFIIAEIYKQTGAPIVGYKYTDLLWVDQDNGLLSASSNL